MRTHSLVRPQNEESAEQLNEVTERKWDDREVWLHLGVHHSDMHESERNAAVGA